MSYKAKAWGRAFDLKIRTSKENLDLNLIELIKLDHHTSDWDRLLIHKLLCLGITHDMTEVISRQVLTQVIRRHLRDFDYANYANTLIRACRVITSFSVDIQPARKMPNYQFR